jgi:glyoxylase-like metal-dependent hydrolase (beta-lactamase superfamily II)
MIEHNSNIREVEDGYEIEPGVTVMHTPGHSPGSISVLVETDYGRCVITGDVLHFSSVALTRKNPLVFWNDDQATKSIDRIVETADLIYPGHDRPFRVVGGKIEYLEPLAVTINGMAREEPGVTFDSSPRPVWIMPGIEEQTEQSLL